MPLNRLLKNRFTNALAICAVLISLIGCASREERIQNIQTEANDAFFADRADQAITILRDGLDKYPDSNKIRIALSTALRSNGDLPGSIALLRAAIQQDSTLDQLWVQVGELHAQLGQSEEAIEAFDLYLTNHGDDFLAWKAITIENEKAGKLTNAIKAATRWNNIAPSASPALKLGELFLATSNIPQARSWFGQSAAYENARDAKDALAELIKLETSLKQFQQATIWLQTYERRYGTGDLDPRIQDSRTTLDNWVKAREEIARVAAEIERERRELEDQNRAAQQNQIPEPAETEVATEVTQNPPLETEQPADNEERAPEALFGEHDEVVGTAQTTENDPVSDQTDALALNDYDAAVAAHQSGNYSEAVNMLWQLLGADASDANLWYLLSTAYYAQENWFDAEATILEAKRRAPRSEQIGAQYARTILKTQSKVTALEEIKKMRLLFPHTPGIALTLAQGLRDANAPRSTVASAYQDFLTIARQGDYGYQEATQYLQNGR